jgi:hypothetical protein
MGERLPRPPVLKTTIIQLNKDLDVEDGNFEILTNEQTSTSSTGAAPSAVPGKKKRRRSTANADAEELAKRKHETKQLHSVIEKRRRLKINREFEALKYLIPACRESGAASNYPNTTSKFNGNKIDGMYKLTILKAAVEYILYLHRTIQRQHSMLSQYEGSDFFDASFADVPLDVNQYRDIDHDFSFNDLHDEKKNHHTVIEEDEEGDSENSSDPTDNGAPSLNNFRQLPSPQITPDMGPILSMMNKHQPAYSPTRSLSRTSSLCDSPRGYSYPSTSEPSPLTTTLKSKVTTRFLLPDPALPADEVAMPQRRMFKTLVPANNTIMSYPGSLEMDEDATKALLALRKSSIDNLLN